MRNIVYIEMHYGNTILGDTYPLITTITNPLPSGAGHIWESNERYDHRKRPNISVGIDSGKMKVLYAIVHVAYSIIIDTQVIH